MKATLPYSLTDTQRIHLGLSQVEPSWELARYRQQYVYFDGDRIRKKISLENDGSYYEADVDEHTAQERTIILPKTDRSKPKKMNASAIQSFCPTGMYFSFSKKYIVVANYRTQTTFYHEGNPMNLTFNEWTDKWVAETTDKDMDELQRFMLSRRKHVKYREGDFFTFRIGRREWGFGRIVMDVRDFLKSDEAQQKRHHGLKNLMGKALYIMVYKKISDRPYADIDELTKCGALPSQAIMDNKFYYGEFPIIGHRHVEANEWEPVISYAQSIHGDFHTVYLQYGRIYKEKNIFTSFIYLMDRKGNPNPFRNESIGFGINGYDIIKELISGSRSIFEYAAYGKGDLRSPANRFAKRIIFRNFRLDARKSYAENLEDMPKM
ncbi:MAG: immunity 26/phosphotriesterase HocA family protein [Bacteroidales bacterium]|nr:immunity 26/phosphotriesterase HocA family protein [Bacteroidales bacterium]